MRRVLGLVFWIAVFVVAPLVAVAAEPGSDSSGQGGLGAGAGG